MWCLCVWYVYDMCVMWGLCAHTCGSQRSMLRAFFNLSAVVCVCFVFCCFMLFEIGSHFVALASLALAM